ncbi:MAG: selenide, water dikinase SelD [Deltaproteobacteria bacterium]|nr:selenide, water dikinase SelD [Deltaproteobacteria bacterium]
MLRDLPKIADPNLLVGVETSDDAGVYKLSDSLAIVQTTDFFPPLVDDPFSYGQIAASNALSDIYAMGAKPLTALNIVCFPDNELPLSILHTILRGASDRTTKAGCVMLGGHSIRDTEIKFGMAVTGTIHPNKIITNASAQEGDVLILTKPLGTGFITTAQKQGKCPQAAFEAALKSMIELNEPACRAMTEASAHSATDITGFGLAGHALEMAMASQKSFVIDLKSLPLFPKTEVCFERKCFTRANRTNEEFVGSRIKFQSKSTDLQRAMLFDPQTSGGLLISVSRTKADHLIKLAKDYGAVLAAKIGEVQRLQGPYLLV